MDNTLHSSKVVEMNYVKINEPLTVNLLRGGQITIPHQIRDLYGIRPGDTMKIVISALYRDTPVDFLENKKNK